MTQDLRELLREARKYVTARETECTNCADAKAAGVECCEDFCKRIDLALATQPAQSEAVAFTVPTDLYELVWDHAPDPIRQGPNYDATAKWCVAMMKDLLSRIPPAQAQQDAKDAARWRYVRQSAKRLHSQALLWNVTGAKNLDAAVDAAMQEGTR